MNIKRAPIALAILTAFILTGCSLDRWISVEPGKYVVVPNHGTAKANALREIKNLEIDRDKRVVVFTLVDGAEITASFVTRDREAWPSGCPANINSTRMEVLDIVEDPLTIESTKAITFSHPILVRDCPPDPMRVVLREDGTIGGSGGACSHLDRCIFFEQQLTGPPRPVPSPIPVETGPVVDIPGSNYSVIELNPLDPPACCLTMTQDGERLAFATCRTMAQKVFVQNVDGSGLKEISSLRIQNGDGPCPDPVWSPDGQYIVFTSDRDGHNEIYVMNRDGTAQRWLMDTDAPQRWRMDITRVRFISSAR